MKVKILIFVLLLILSVSLSNAVKTIIVDETELVHLKPKATDPDADQLFYTFTKPLDREGKWQTTYGDAGEYKVSVTVSDGESSTSKDILLVVRKKNIGPSIDSFSPEEMELTIDEGEGIDFRVKASDLNKDLLEYRWKLDEKIVSEKESYSYKADYKDAGEYKIKVVVSDGEEEEEEVEKEWAVKVIDKDRKPVFKPITNVWVKENQKVIIELEAYDPDNDKIEFSAENLPSGAILKGNKFEWAIGYDAVRKESRLDKVLDKFHLLYKPFKIRFIAKSKELEVEQSVLIIVKDVNRKPVLGDISPIMVNEGEEIIIKPEASDPDGDNMIYSYSGWINTDRYITNYDDAGMYKVKVTASDGFLRDEKYVAIEVRDVNRKPIFGEIGKVEIDENEKMELRLYASDADGDSVRVNAESLPRNSTIEDYVFRWVPDYDTASDDFKIVGINFKASDGKDETVKEVNITVYNVNRMPKIISASPGRSIKVNKNKKIKFEVNVEDPDKDKLSYLWKFGFLEQYKAGNAIIRTFTSAGDKKVRVVVSDGEDEVEYVWRVKVV